VTRSLSIRQTAILGLVVLVCLATGVWGLFRVSAKSGLWADGQELTIVAADAQNVEPGTPVRVRGIEYGRVTAVEAAGDNVHIRVQFDRKACELLHADASATVQTKGVLGVSVVDVKAGSAKSGPLEASTIPMQPTPDLAEVTAKLSAVAGRVDAILKEVQDGDGTLPKLLRDDAVYRDLKTASADTQKLVKNLDETTSALRGDAQKTLKGVDESVQSVRNELEGMKTFVRNGQEAVTAIKQDAEAIKSMPIVRSYVEDPVSALVRPDCEKDRVVYVPELLFQTGTSILTEEGKARLNECAAWLNGQRQKNSEVVVAAFADPKSPDLTAPGARMLTKKQAETIAEYFKERGVHKMGYVTRRKVTPVGHGFDPSPVVEKDPLPASRIEVILFWPR
jgi:phospholipid/cholesterol/gamma-HCH transport system substrate-binding protein